MANQYVKMLEQLDRDVQSSPIDGESVISMFAKTIEAEYLDDRDFDKWFSTENSGMTRNVKAIQTAIEKVLGRKYYIQLEPIGSTHRVNIYKAA